ncbi:MAG: alpha/beta fold hydrolase [Thermodesulfobacteriota bacterium]
MANFFFIHGGMHGAWCWGKVIDILKNDGHHCLDIDLPGAGLDRTPRSEITFDSYMEKIDHFIDVNELKDINLVGHSMAGMLLPKIAVDEKAGVSNIIFLATYILEKGESVFDLMPEEGRKIVLAGAEKLPDSSFMFDYEDAKKICFEDLDEESARNYYGLLTPQPIAPFYHKSDLELSSVEQPMHYVVCRRDVAVSKDLSTSFINKINCDTHEIDSGHDAMLSRPYELAKLLESIAL